MNKQILVVSLIISLCVLLSGASGLEISTSIAIEGEGTLDRETEINTDMGTKSGLKYSENIYSQSLGLYRHSEINYTSEIQVVAEGENSTIDVSSAFELTNIVQEACIKNYEIMVGQCNWLRGDEIAAMTFTADNRSSAMDAAIEAEGKGGYKLQAKNETDVHKYIYLDRADYEHDMTLLITSFIAREEYPASDIPEDWLCCP